MVPASMLSSIATLLLNPKNPNPKPETLIPPNPPNTAKTPEKIELRFLGLWFRSSASGSGVGV